jgi:hypothetical protein
VKAAAKIGHQGCQSGRCQPMICAISARIDAPPISDAAFRPLKYAALLYAFFSLPAIPDFRVYELVFPINAAMQSFLIFFVV